MNGCRGVRSGKVLSLEVCKSFHMFLSLLAEAMVTLRIAATWTVVTTLQPILMVNHMLLMAKLHSNSPKYLCTMAAHQLLEVMAASVRNSHNSLMSAVHNRMLAHRLSQCKAWFLVNH